MEARYVWIGKRKIQTNLRCILNALLNWCPHLKQFIRTNSTLRENRAIVFKLNEKIPEAELKHCILMA